MTTPTNTNDARATAVSIGDDELSVDLADGRCVVVPLEWFSKLSAASPGHLKKFEIVDGGREVHWNELGEQINIAGLLRGIAALDGD